MYVCNNENFLKLVKVKNSSSCRSGHGGAFIVFDLFWQCLNTNQNKSIQNEKKIPSSIKQLNYFSQNSFSECRKRLNCFFMDYKHVYFHTLEVLDIVYHDIQNCRQSQQEVKSMFTNSVLITKSIKIHEVLIVRKRRIFRFKKFNQKPIISTKIISNIVSNFLTSYDNLNFTQH